MKIFHKRKGIYENKYGYLGGITLALMTAKIFQLYPNYNSSQLIERFLYVYGYIWDWTKWRVRIVEERNKPSEHKNPIEKVESNPYAFNELGFKNRRRFFEIYTPAWPQMNSTYNVNYSTREVIVKTYKRFHEVFIQKIQETKEQGNKIKEIWLNFFDNFDFFKNYDQFIEFIIVGNNEDEYLRWKGFIEAKTRIFVEKLEFLMNHIDFDM